MNLDMFDPTTSVREIHIDYVPRPKNLEGLRIGLLENSKHNSDVLLLKIADRLKERYGMEMTLLAGKKSAADFVSDDLIARFREEADFVIAGIGD
jgi:hypothetical protein